MSGFFDEWWERKLADGVGLASLIPLETRAPVTQVADGVGFEPTVGLHPRRFSRPLP
jgi:hypothetical protein